jgi:cell division protein FtsB
VLNCAWWKKWDKASRFIAAIGMGMAVISLEVYLYISANNGVIKKRIAIPTLQKELKEIMAENQRLQHEINQFESPSHLMELMRKPDYSHLRPLFQNEVVEIAQ